MDTSHAKFDKEMVEEYKLEIQETLGVLNPQGLPLGGGPSAIESSILVAPAVFGGTATAPSAESGTPLAHLRWSPAQY